MANNALDGSMLSFVSSSVAIDKYQNAARGKPLVLEDGVGEWSDSAGRMRSFIPFTTGEYDYNLAMQDLGLDHFQRIAIWPQSSIIPLNLTHGLLYAAIVYNDSAQRSDEPLQTYAGNTLLTISMPDDAGPHAVRVVKSMFHQNLVAFGTVGGIRAYGPAGPGGNDGRVYLFGKETNGLANGLFLARVDAIKIADINAVSPSTVCC
jgi:hypothetical protein